MLKPDISSEGESNEAKNLEGQVCMSSVAKLVTSLFFGAGCPCRLFVVFIFYIFVIIYVVANKKC